MPGQASSSRTMGMGSRQTQEEEDGQEEKDDDPEEEEEPEGDQVVPRRRRVLTSRVNLKAKKSHGRKRR